MYAKKNKIRYGRWALSILIIFPPALWYIASPVVAVNFFLIARKSSITLGTLSTEFIEVILNTEDRPLSSAIYSLIKNFL